MNFYLSRSYFDDTLHEEDKQLISASHSISFNKQLSPIDNDLNQKKYPSFIEVAFCTTVGSYGLKATKDISPDTLIGIYAGRIVKDVENNKAYNFSIAKDYSIDANDEGNYTRFINHSKEFCNAAAYCAKLIDTLCPQIVITTLMPIFKGDWILLDYGDTYFEALGIKPLLLTPTDP